MVLALGCKGQGKTAIILSYALLTEHKIRNSSQQPDRLSNDAKMELMSEIKKKFKMLIKSHEFQKKFQHGCLKPQAYEGLT
jgi:hypothetical protein